MSILSHGGRFPPVFFYRTRLVLHLVRGNSSLWPFLQNQICSLKEFVGVPSPTRRVTVVNLNKLRHQSHQNVPLAGETEVNLKSWLLFKYGGKCRFVSDYRQHWLQTEFFTADRDRRTLYRPAPKPFRRLRNALLVSFGHAKETWGLGDNSPRNEFKNKLCSVKSLFTTSIPKSQA